MQADGNLVEYLGSKPLWASNTYGVGAGPYDAFMQSDGNLVVYQKGGQAANLAIFTSNTYGKGTPPYQLKMQNDGNVVIYDANNTALWATNTYAGSAANANPPPATVSVAVSTNANGSFTTLTSPGGYYTLVMQADGNLVEYLGSKPLWASNTYGVGAGPYEAFMQSDGNLVVYQKGGQVGQSAIFNTNSHNRGTPPYRLTLQDDGNVVIYDTNNLAIWATSTSVGSAANPTGPVLATLVGSPKIVPITYQDIPDGHFSVLLESDGVTWTSYFTPNTRVQSKTGNLPEDMGGASPDFVPYQFEATAPTNWAYFGNFDMVVGPTTQKIPAASVTGLREDGKQYDENGAWAMSVFRLADTSEPTAARTELIAFLHFEDHYENLTNGQADSACWWSLGVSYSHDGGVTWERGVPIITSSQPQPANPAQITAGSAGAGNNSVVWDSVGKRWLNFFEDSNVAGSDGSITMGVSTDARGGPGTWTKFDPKTGKSTPGFGGAANSLSALGGHPYGNNALSYNQADGRWILVFDDGNNISYSISTDLVNWTTPAPLQLPTTHAFSPTIVGTDATHANGPARLYYADYQTGNRVFTGIGLSW